MRGGYREQVQYPDPTDGELQDTRGQNWSDDRPAPFLRQLTQFRFS
jgi:hypothetical protein